MLVALVVAASLVAAGVTQSPPSIVLFAAASFVVASITQRASVHPKARESLRQRPQIETTLVAQYGPGILSTPSTGGFSLSAYVVPLVGVLGAALAIAFVIISARSRRRRPDDDLPDAITPVTGPEDARLDAALSVFRRQA